MLYALAQKYVFSSCRTSSSSALLLSLLLSVREAPVRTFNYAHDQDYQMTRYHQIRQHTDRFSPAKGNIDLRHQHENGERKVILQSMKNTH